MIPFAVLGLPSVAAIYYGLAAVIYGKAKSYLHAQDAISHAVLFAGIWVLIEFARGHLLTGFPWNLMALSWSFSPTMLQPLTLLGASINDLHGHGRGDELLCQVARRLSSVAADADLIAFLVGEHLTMSHVAQKEDLSDPDVIARFAGRVGNERQLTALYLLTVADIRGTSPKVWNAWKGKLLEDLYRYTLRALGGSAPDAGAEIEADLVDDAAPADRTEALVGRRLDAHRLVAARLDRREHGERHHCIHQGIDDGIVLAFVGDFAHPRRLEIGHAADRALPALSLRRLAAMRAYMRDINLGREPFVVTHGLRVAQMVERTGYCPRL